jgi:hypothetical protein
MLKEEEEKRRRQREIDQQQQQPVGTSLANTGMANTGTQEMQQPNPKPPIDQEEIKRLREMEKVEIIDYI